MSKATNTQMNNLVALLDGYFESGAFHTNINVFDRETLIDAQKNPDLHRNLTVRVSGLK